MRVVVVGSNGATGRHVVRQALERGVEVTAVVRDRSAYGEHHAALLVVQADVLEPESMTDVALGADAVVSAIGIGTSRAPTTLYSAGTANIVVSMERCGCSRLVAVSAVPAGPWDTSAWMQRRVVLPMLQRFFGATYDDMRVMEQWLHGTVVDWTVVRPPRLTNRSARGAYRTSTTGPVRGGAITRADLASALLDAIDDQATKRQAIWIAN